MINGIYKVSFEVELKNHVNEEEAHESIMAMVKEMLEQDQFPEVNFELLEEEDLEYSQEEDELEEISFEEAV